MRLRIHRSDGKTGNYHQDVANRITTLVKRLNPAAIFSSGPIVIGVHNPFSVINADEVCWIEVETEAPVELPLPQGLDTLKRLAGRDEYEAILAQQWPRWQTFRKGAEGDLFEALIEVSLTSGQSVFLHATGVVSAVNLVDEVFKASAITASFEPNGAIYINPKCVVRARVYHSKNQVNHPNGLWFAEADDI